MTGVSAGDLRFVWKWDDGAERVTATCRTGGWPQHEHEPHGRKEVCRSVEERRAAGLDPCRKPAEWKIERREGTAVRCAWYCTRDLPCTEAPPRDAERTQ